MSVFTEAELEFLQSKRIGRVATIDAKGDLHVVPLRFKYNSQLDVIDLVGSDVGGTKKYRDVEATGRAAFVVDDIEDHRPRGVEIRGRAEAHATGGGDLAEGVGPTFIRLTPMRVASWGIHGDTKYPKGRDVGKT
ncbi:MAG TPA: PPOX class F420-dependent oxidoreductase [Chloroflexia bacterium]|nr:PPOX class F420-dependent oxidoreductase [Chloroflexia bacterium]